MIEFYSENNFQLEDSEKVSKWIAEVVSSYEKEVGEVAFIFCGDMYLHQLNLQFLNHDTFTDIISFDNSLGDQINGEVYISTERVKENASNFSVSFENELHRVIIHGILHFCGLKDKSENEVEQMRRAEDAALSIRKFV